MVKVFKKPYSKVYSACREALQELDIPVRYSSNKRGAIRAETEFSLFSWGEEIQINLYKTTGDEIEVIVNSSSKAQLIDWGRNETNERNIVREISRLLKNT